MNSEVRLINKDYPSFTVPLSFAEKPHREWTPKEADQYFEWFLSVLDERVGVLLAYLDETESGKPEERLERAGKKLYVLLQDQQFSSGKDDDGLLKLAGKGFVMAFDMGLLMAKLILKECKPLVTWSIVRRPKSDMNYNTPVLVGFDPITTIDPIGSSLGCASWVLKEGPDTWKAKFQAWKEGVQGEPLPKNCWPPKKKSERS